MAAQLNEGSAGSRSAEPKVGNKRKIIIISDGLSFMQGRSLSLILSKRLSHTQVDVLGLGKNAFDNILQGAPEYTRYRATQAYAFVHGRDVDKSVPLGWEEARMLPASLRSHLTEVAPLNYGTLVSGQASFDGTRKYLLRLSQGRIVETVLIPETDRATLCVSSQVGCSLACAFCHTGTQSFMGNLSSGDILRQFWALPTGIRSLVTNFVFMGQGEPLYNWRALSQAVAILTDPRGGLGFGRGKITVSTSGVVPLIPRIASELGVNLAISLHAPTDELRTRIMPINKTYPLEGLMAACAQFIAHASCATRRISFEYVMLAGINDSPRQAHQLAQLIKHLPAHVNLIPFNPWPGAPYECSPSTAIDEFSRILEQERGIPTTVRRARGRDIMAACGQLKSSELSKGTGRETKEQPCSIPINKSPL